MQLFEEDGKTPKYPSVTSRTVSAAVLLLLTCFISTQREIVVGSAVQVHGRPQGQ